MRRKKEKPEKEGESGRDSSRMPDPWTPNPMDQSEIFFESKSLAHLSSKLFILSHGHSDGDG
jgi:hypothetical protein